jgi:hypothetical protein
VSLDQVDDALRALRGEPGNDPRSPIWRADHAKIAAAIAGLDNPKAPAGWEERVLARIDAAPPARPASRRLPWLLAGAGLLAAAAVLAVWVRREPTPVPRAELAVSLEVLSGGSVRSEKMAAVGDELTVEARFPGQGELRVYRDDLLLARCPGHKGCYAQQVDGSLHLQLEIALHAPGPVRAIAFAGAGVPVPTGSMVRDLDAAVSAGIEMKSSMVVDVH